MSINLAEHQKIHCRCGQAGADVIAGIEIQKNFVSIHLITCTASGHTKYFSTDLLCAGENFCHIHGFSVVDCINNNDAFVCQCLNIFKNFRMQTTITCRNAAHCKILLERSNRINLIRKIKCDMVSFVANLCEFNQHIRFNIFFNQRTHKFGLMKAG